MPRIVTWDRETAKKELSSRLRYAMETKRYLEREWQENERTIFNTRGDGTLGINGELSSYLQEGFQEDDSSNPDLGINYAFKNTRFIHSQLSANPPTVVPRPTSSDQEDRRKADAADRLIRHAIRHYKTQEKFDLMTLNTLIYGTGITKLVWNPDAGEPIDFDEDTGEVTMEGDISVSTPSPWNIYIDPDATTPEDLKYVFERIYVPWDEALYMFPSEEDREFLKAYREQQDNGRSNDERQSEIRNYRYDSVELFQYWEKGAPYNGMIGRYCWLVKTGDVLGEVSANPFRFKYPVGRGVDTTEIGRAPREDVPGRAQLPYQFLTDVDVPGQVWGKAVLCYETGLQDMHNRLLNVTVESIQAHGIPRIILPEGAEISDDSITNSPWDIIKITGNQPPSFMEPMPLPPAVTNTLMQMRQGIDDMAGVTEANFGQSNREQSAQLMQYANNQSNMIRRRLFNKYVLIVEAFYKDYLSLIKENWDSPRTIRVLGKEKAFEALDIQGADVEGGFDLIVEYGASLSLDPTNRREEILTLLPIFEKAGVDTRTILQMLKLNELEGLYDEVQMAADRQREIFETMRDSEIYIEPKELEDHVNMLLYAYKFRMSSEFKYLPEAAQALIERHMKDREQMEVNRQQTSRPGPMPNLGGELPAEAALPGAGTPI